MLLDTNNIIEYTMIGLGSLVLVILGIQNIYNKWSSANAENSMITLMHAELERLSSQNTKLSKELSKLQLEIVSLNTQLRKLTSENQNLHLEVSSLTKEIGHLQLLLESYKLKDANNDAS